ncbi:MAG: flagellar basal body P-ring protein FlgI [Oligoflexia bacterium]|nr:flagellar basal body P-ring protein FlgI [Oligoflexia bacterium]
MFNFRRTFLLLSLMLLLPHPAHAARIKDIADVEGVRGNQLFGFGIVVGLNGTGDGNGAQFTTKGMSNLLDKLGIRLNPQDIKSKNIASVMVTSTLPAFVRPGSKLDILVSAIGDAKSLQGGTLLFTPLKGADGNTYAVAQGSLTVGGFSVEGGGGDSAQKNHPTVATIALGASVERAIPFDLFQSQRVRIVLREPDFSTVTNMVSRINAEVGRPLAVAVDGASVEVAIVEQALRDPVGFLSRVENIQVDPDTSARVVVNERTGTVIMGGNVSISQVALAHGNLNIAIRTETQVSQPGALAERGNTAVVTNDDVTVGEEQGGFNIIGGQAVTLNHLVDALNALGATPRDLISIFMALKKAGALQAELIVM